MICHILQQVPCHIHAAHHYSSDHPCPNAETTWEGSQGKGQAGSFPKVMLQVNSPLDSHPLIPLSICILTLTHCNGNWGKEEKLMQLVPKQCKKWKQVFGLLLVLSAGGGREVVRACICHWVREWVDLWPAGKPTCCRIKKDISVRVTAYYFFWITYNAGAVCFVWPFWRWKSRDARAAWQISPE